jgi:hypothetical protein
MQGTVQNGWSVLDFSKVLSLYNRQDIGSPDGRKGREQAEVEDEDEHDNEDDSGPPMDSFSYYGPYGQKIGRSSTTTFDTF